MKSLSTSTIGLTLGGPARMEPIDEAPPLLCDSLLELIAKTRGDGNNAAGAEILRFAYQVETSNALLATRSRPWLEPFRSN